jgi:hypothetical protein
VANCASRGRRRGKRFRSTTLTFFAPDGFLTKASAGMGNATSERLFALPGGSLRLAPQPQRHRISKRRAGKKLTWAGGRQTERRCTDVCCLNRRRTEAARRTAPEKRAVKG